MQNKLFEKSNKEWAETQPDNQVFFFKHLVINTQ